jgi:hypothetical protein
MFLAVLSKSKHGFILNVECGLEIFKRFRNWFSSHS